MKISVCIPSYNQADYIEQSVRSVFAQTLQPYEVIVSNDSSTDETKSILDNLAKEFKKLKIIHQPLNLGMVKNTNHCLRLANGEFIVKLDSDDYLLPEYIEVLSSLLIKYPEAGYAHGAVQEINVHGESVVIRKLFRKTGFVNSDIALRSCVKGYKVAANIIMFRKDVLNKVNYITSNVDFAEDYYLSAQIAALGYGNVYSEKILSCYRVWEDAGNIRQKRKLNEINGLRIIFEKVITPAFFTRGWDQATITKATTNLASRQASCLGWSIYSEDEKLELEKAIIQLSNNYKTYSYIWIYKNGYGNIINAYDKFLSWSRRKTKNIFLLIPTYK